jgi:single-strand DNA-binding protein
MTWQQVIVDGSLGKDPETRFTPSGMGCCTFSMAVSEGWTDKQTGEKKERTTWFNCEAWGKPGEIVQQWWKKGQRHTVVGQIQTEEWNDKQTGEKRRGWKLRVDSIKFGNNKREDGDDKPRQQSRPAAQPAEKQQQMDMGDIDDDIPFAFPLGAFIPLLGGLGMIGELLHGAQGVL